MTTLPFSLNPTVKQRLTVATALDKTAPITKVMERKNSNQSGHRTRKISGFFVPDFYIGRATNKTPAREISPLGSVRVLNLPIPLSVAHKNVPMRFLDSQRSVFMLQSTPLNTQDKFDLFDTLTRDIAQAKAVLQIIMLGEIDPTTLNTKILADTCWMLSDKLDYIETNAKALMEVQA